MSFDGSLLYFSTGVGTAKVGLCKHFSVFQNESCCKSTSVFSINKSSCSQIFFKIGVLENSAIFAGKHLC